MAPTRFDIQAAVQATDAAIEAVLDDQIRGSLRHVVEIERRAVLSMLFDYETAVGAAAGIERTEFRSPDLSSSERIERAVRQTNGALDELDPRGRPAVAVWHERAVVALLCGGYSNEVERQWKMKRAAPVALVATDGQVNMLVGESPLTEMLREFDADDGGQPPGKVLDMPGGLG